MLEALGRPHHPDVRWTTSDQWHVTLRFLGDVPDDDVAALREALDGLAGRPATAIALGPRTTRLGRGQLVLPATGADDLAAAVATATAPFGPSDDRPFRGHLTLARARRRARGGVPAELTGTPVDARWPATEVALVRSHLDPGGARYETIHRVPLTR